MSMDDDKVVELLKGVDLFRGLSRRELNRLIASARDITHAEGHQVVEEGNTALGFHLVVEGHAAVSQQGKHLRDIGPGDYFGEISMLDGKPRSASVVATEPLRTLWLNHTKFMALLDQHAEISHSVMAGLCARLRALEKAH
ncbi:MAG TPA: cyclic nucleotide-binding domain-containing protein [Jatrophihabitantaceae bacterium]|nr:cyclic nucleotide-binding domain-containing protein [Jatrophihabitantaceae bacterium]